MQVVQAKDHLGRDATLPVAGSRKYELLPDQPRLDNVTYETVADIINDDNRPKKVSHSKTATFIQSFSFSTYSVNT